MGKFINPFSDWGFKRIFGQEPTKDLLIHFLNQLLKGERCITDITFLDKERIGELSENRGIIYDIYCTTDTGEHIIVEMQNSSQVHFIMRSVYYASRAVVDQGEKGKKWRYRLNPVYMICFMNFDHSENMLHQFRTDCTLMEKTTHKEIYNGFRIIYLVLPLFKEKEEDCKTLFDCWIYVLKHMDVLDRMPFLAKNAVFEKLAEISELSALSKEEREKYDESIKVMRDNLAVQEASYKAGIEKGRAEGMEKGFEKGITETARRMKAIGISAEDIARATNLSEEEIAAL